MFFRDVVGQKEVKNRLIKSVKEERVSHAQLFAGPEGTGKLPLALAYAQYVSCRDRGEDDSCGTCPSCRKFSKLIHPDLHFVFPVFKQGNIKNPVSDDFIVQWREFMLKSPYFTLNQWLKEINVENSQGLIYEKESESILKKLNLKSFESEFKFMIIWLPEKMHKACANKLLKMIEEPPNKTLFLLISEDEENIINTIRSRAQLVSIPFIDNDSMRKALSKPGEFDEDTIEEVVHLSNGNYLKAIEFLNPDEDKLYYLAKLKELMRAAYTIERPIPLIEWSEEIARIGREKQKSFLEYALRLVREYFILNLKNPDLVYLNKEEKSWGNDFSPFVNERNVLQMYSEFDLAFKHISMNGNPRIIFMDVALKMAKILKK
ncbi:MAG: DNA polymerase III subunit delta [Prolixibacteraceae bacterium]|nr:DNA polymerase III subunit delta [Prolixibacteraceae bacterium]